MVWVAVTGAVAAAVAAARVVAMTVATRLPGPSFQPALGLVLRKYLELDIRSLCREILCKKLRPMKQTEFRSFSL